MALTPGSNGYDVNVYANIREAASAQPIINTCCPDNIEDVYSFTLDEPTELLIAIAPEVSSIDLDLFVVNGEQPNQNFFADDSRFDADVDFSGGNFGLETIAREFQPGTYYILVTLFDEGNLVTSTDYGLLVTQAPMILETFSSPASFGEWFLSADSSDSDGQPGWAVSSGFGDTKFGDVLEQAGAAAGTTESSIAVSPLVQIPDSGLVVIDFDMGTLNATPPNETFSVTLVDSSGTPAQSSVYNWNNSADRTTVTYNGTNLNMIGWNHWAETTLDSGDYTIAENLAGTERGVGVWCSNQGARWVIDNVRVFNIFTSATAKAAPGKVLVRPKTGQKGKRNIPLMQKRK